MNISLSLRTSPSNIAKIMESGCLRSLYFHSVSDGEKGGNIGLLKKYYGIDLEQIRSRTAVKNRFRQDAGNQLEMDILTDRNIPEKLNITTYGVKGRYYPKATSNNDKVDLDKTLSLLVDLTDPDALGQKLGMDDLKYFYQLTFVATEEFKKQFQFDPLFDFNISYPDLVMITREDDGVKLSIIDIKMAEHIRLKQKLQVTLYALLLDYMIQELSKSHDMHTVNVDLKVGYIWHRGKAEPTPFDMEEVLPYVKNYLEKDILSLAKTVRAFCETENADVTALPEQIPHRLCSRCEYCEYMDYCLEQSRQSDDYQRLPYLSPYGQRCLEELYARAHGDSPASLSCGEIQMLLGEQMQDTTIADSIRRNPALREYVKETDDGLMIDRYRKLLSMTADFDYSQAAELAYDAEKGTIDPKDLSAFLTSLDRQKELDRAFLQERLDKLQAQITRTALPEDSPERRHLDSLCAYQQKKLKELDTVKALSRSLAAKLNMGTGTLTEELATELAKDLTELSRKNLAPKAFVVRGRALSDFPKGTSDTVDLYLTAQKDELTNRMFTLGYSCALPWGVTLPGLSRNAEAVTAQSSPRQSAQPDVSEEDPDRPQSETCVLIADSETDFDRIEREFIEKLHALFLSIHEYNKPYLEAENTGSLQSGMRKLRLQCFVMDAYESDNLIEYLYDMLERSGETLAEKIMDVLSWLQDERMADQDQSRSSIICDYPFISLSQTVRRTFLLPTNIAYRFDDISNLFVTGRPFRKNTNYYSNYFNNSISAGFIREHWKDPSNEKFAVSKLETELRVRLMQESMIREGILKELNTETALTGKKFLLSYAPVFSLPERNCYTHPLLSKLDFQNRYEEILTRLKMRNARIGDVGDLIADNVITPVRYLGFHQTAGQDYYGQPLECHNFEILEEDAGMTIPDMGLTFSPATENALLEFVERGNIVTTDGYWGKFSKGIEKEDNILHITLEHKDAFSFEERMLYYMFERYTNWTSPYITGGFLMPNSRSAFRGILKNIDERDPQDAGCLAEDVISLLDDPCSFVLQYRERHTADTPLNRITADESTRYEKTYFMDREFFPSQQKAFLQFYNQNLSLVQGPPGTGKTNFIAMSVLIYLIRQHEAGAAPQKIFITSNSHVAIENVLHKIAELVSYIKAKDVVFDVPLKIYQLKREGVTIPEGIEAYDKEKINYILTGTDAEENNIVIGATVWALEKPFQKGTLDSRTHVFDVAIIDEASQVRLIDSTIALAHVKKDGKILLVGDHEQLPPIIQGTYEINEEKPFTAGSVFQYFIDHDLLYHNEEHKDPLYSKRLDEQFRMNEILSLYPSLQIYEGKYRPALDEVARQTLRLAPAATSAEIPDEGVLKEADMPALCDWLMDPEYPFVLCNIRSNREGSFLTADAKKNFEIELVKQLSDCCIHRLYRHQKDTDTALYDDAEKFWHEGMFIISPHHEHINRLRSAVKDLRREDLPEDRAAFGEHAFIDTVDKMQGQEAEIALVSYGIADEEQALREKEFVFNRNRLNVSITRGKKKMILILTDVLTDKQLELMAEEDQQLIDSIAFMNGIKTFASEEKNATLSQSKKLIAQDGEIAVELYRKKMLLS